MGTPHAAVPSLQKILGDGHEVVAVYTQPDRPGGRGQKLQISPVKRAALDNNIPVYQPLKLRIPETIDAFRAHKADVALVVAYGRILAREYLSAYPRGAINVHFSLLPKYRGAAPVNWAIVNGEKETGVTTMLMDEGLDTGDILVQQTASIGDEENSIDLMSKLAHLGAQILSDTLSCLDAIEPRKQDDSDATLAPILKKDDGRIDWKMGSEGIANRVRGFQPFPGTFTYFRGKSLKIWRASPDPVDHSEPVGMITEMDRYGVSVACGQGVLQLLEVQPEGKKRMPIADFINGAKPTEGEVFG